eukprot:117698-Chlamydomonas_euryale.AAC.1
MRHTEARGSEPPNPVNSQGCGPVPKKPQNTPPGISFQLHTPCTQSALRRRSWQSSQRTSACSRSTLGGSMWRQRWRGGRP